MGLDIIAYEKVTFVKEELEDNDSDKRLKDNYTHIVVNSHFSERADGLKTGYYNCGGKSHSFRAGSYFGYNLWRRRLVEFAGITLDEAWSGNYTGPFSELINFSDCDGVIGPQTSAKLYKDFLQFHERAKMKNDVFLFELYEDFMTAFELASHGGAVKFA